MDVLRLFDGLCRAGRTLVLVTHDSRIAATADRVISMRDGVFVSETQLAGRSSASSRGWMAEMSWGRSRFTL
jgi:putative ABC transport system ATP-binding protein